MPAHKTILTRNQIYAAAIFKQVRDEVKTKPPEYQKRYGSMAHKLPVLIRTAGLAQALSFIESRGEPEHLRLLEHLSKTVNVGDLGGRSREADLYEYMGLTQKVLAALLWYKRFAQSVLKVDATSEGGGASGS